MVKFNRLRLDRRDIIEMLSQGLRSQDEAAAEMGTSAQVISEDVKRARIRQGYSNTRALVRAFVTSGGNYTEADELPDADEPQGPVQRCNLCGLVPGHTNAPPSAPWTVPNGRLEGWNRVIFDDLSDAYNRTRPTLARASNMGGCTDGLVSRRAVTGSAESVAAVAVTGRHDSKETGRR